ncbi:hypothetical protein C8P66_10417 [Humitalea rosea]|uniref:Uncharacterized protein n=1 Tax=Humitalea rosea TaxID=990373 RepID=A0A2W7IQM2_9PROT|nr:hypothetical protein C8P66_10417 [Humitalea rosea]
MRGPRPILLGVDASPAAADPGAGKRGDIDRMKVIVIRGKGTKLLTLVQGRPPVAGRLLPTVSPLPLRHRE